MRGGCTAAASDCRSGAPAAHDGRGAAAAGAGPGLLVARAGTHLAPVHAHQCAADSCVVHAGALSTKTRSGRTAVLQDSCELSLGALFRKKVVTSRSSSNETYVYCMSKYRQSSPVSNARQGTAERRGPNDIHSWPDIILRAGWASGLWPTDRSPILAGNLVARV